jgi:nucleoside-diphosphate kinase
MDVDTYCFNAEWHDPQADLVRPYIMYVFQPKGDAGPLELQIWDPKANRTFLKRAPLSDLRMEDLFVGGTLTVHARQMRLTAYANESTKAKLEGAIDCFGLVTSPDAFPEFGGILSTIEGAGLAITRLRLVAEGGPVVAMQVSGTGGMAAWEVASMKLRPGSCKKVSSSEVLPYFEDTRRYPTTAVFSNCTVCLIRPHILKDGRAGEIVSSIMKAGFEVSAAKMVHFTRVEAAEFLDVYKGVIPHYPSVIDAMTSTPCLALELRKDADVVPSFRELCGPHDIEIARHLRPGTLRARFGEDSARNALHCTDLEEDGELESRYIFELIG